MKLKPKQIQALTASIESERDRSSLSYAGLARLSGVEASQVNKICHGHFRSLTANVVQICKALGIEGEQDTTGYGALLSAAIVSLWDKTPDDGARLLRLLSSLRDIRTVR